MGGGWTTEERPLAAVAVTRGPKQHFFGYYDKPQSDASGRFLLGQECDVIGRLQRPDDIATLGLVDLDGDNAWTPLADVSAWNWQMGCMPQWIPRTGNEIVHNDRRDGRLVSIVRNAVTREARELPRPVFDLSPDGRSALSLNFARLWTVRPETGYCGVEDPWGPDPAPRDDGLHLMDMGSGESSLVVPLARMAALRPEASMPGATHYFTHPQFNSDGSRFSFWHRWKGGTRTRSRLCTASLDGSDIVILADPNSHSTWFGRDKVLAWAWLEGKPHNYLFTDRTDSAGVLGEGTLDFNGHSTFSSDGKWLLTDLYGDDLPERTLILCDLAARRRYDIGRFRWPPELKGPLRCDLHPRWVRGGKRVCFDSTHDGSRQMYVVDVGEIVNAR